MPSPRREIVRRAETAVICRVQRSPSAAGPLQLRRVWRPAAVLRRRWKIAAATMACAVGGGLLARQLCRPVFEACAWVAFRGEQAAGGSVVPLDPQVDASVHRTIATQIELENASAVAGNAGANWRASIMPGTQLICITADGADPAKAASTANAAAEQTISRCRDELPEPDVKMPSALAEQLQRADAQLQSLRQDKLLLPEETPADDAAARTRQISTLLTEIARYQRLGEEIEIDRNAALEAVKTGELPADLLSGSTTQPPEPDPAQLDQARAKDPLYRAAQAEQTAAFEACAAQMALGKTDRHRDVVIAKQRLARAQDAVTLRDKALAVKVIEAARLRQRQAEQRSMAQARLRIIAAASQAVACQRRLDDLHQQLDHVRQADLTARQTARQRNELDAKMDHASHLRRVIVDRLDELQRQRAAHPIVRMWIARPAEPPPTAARDSRELLAGGWLGAGIVMSLLVSFVAERFDRRLRDVADLEAILGVPVVGTIPHVNELAQPDGQDAQARLATTIREVRGRLLVDRAGRRSATLGIVSPERGDATTGVAIALALSIAKTGWRVLLVDADISSPAVHKAFAAPLAPGFCDLIENFSDCSSAIRRTPNPQLDLLPAGIWGDAASDLLCGPRVAALLSDLLREYDQVIVAAPALAGSTQLAPFFECLDAIVCAIPTTARRDAVQALAASLGNVKDRLRGAVLCQADGKAVS